MIKEDSVREVIEMARVEDIVGDYVNLRRRGQNMIGLCPFHNEKTPSFNVNPARNIYKCFGCGEGGDPVKFLMTLEQLSFPEAIRKIAARYNFKLEEVEVSEEVKEERREKESLLLVNEFARQFYEDQLYNTDEGKSVGLSYFKSRGFRKDVMQKFGLGYAPFKRDALFKAATAAGYKPEQLDKLGLIRNKKDFFFDRVMFTIHNLQGKPIAFAGRILKTNVKAPKYVNSPETEVYHKSDVLYGIYQARQSIRKLDNVYMVEGYTDVISLHQHGVTNVVATSGTSLTPGQARLVKRQTENVTLLYDGDKAGIKAALRGVDVLLIEGLNVRVVILPDGEDPDSYMQKVGTTAFEKFLVDSRRDFLFFKSDLLLEEAGDDVAARSEAIRSSISTLALVDDPLKRQGYVQQFSGRLGLEESLLINLVNTAVAERREKAKRDAEREARRRQRGPVGQRPARRQKEGYDHAPFPGTPPPNSAPAAAPPPKADSSDENWAGMEDMGWAGGGEEDGWGGPPDAYFGPEPGFGPDPGPAPSEDSLDRVGSPLILTGETYQELDLARLLIRHGSSHYDEEQHLSVGTFLTRNIADLLNDFDAPIARKVVLMVMEVSANELAPPPEFFLNHEDEKIRQLAIEATTKKYSMSPNWREKYDVILRQKLPEDNQRAYADNFLRIFRMEKIDRKCRENIAKIKELDRAGDEDGLILHLKVQQQLDQMRKELAAELGTVIL
ncbi:DNA primase [Lewinella sp. 4G2]|uniref:DNA primase n=1 Tax=Lewinella sp. 4G2 TaxID=1803372 RepID=UPI0007B4F6D8|nr:DNA primase [Lewinella sp. 4G2]OAV45620.1 DNA primase [Lewinella sp. 4G2]